MEASVSSKEQELIKTLEGKIPATEQSDSVPYKDLEQLIYLIHGAEFYRTAGASTDRLDVYTVDVRLCSDSKELLEKIEKVVYVKHHSFKKRREESMDRENSFPLTERLWGQFNLKAEVYFKGLERPLILYRYLNF